MIERYFLVATLEQALRLLNESGANSKIIAGGTDLVLEIEKKAHNNLSTIIDISRVPGLDKIEKREDGKISIGALVTHNQVIQSELLWKYATCLAEACLQVGSPQIRNRGTVVGNLVTASPANDTITPLIVLDAVLRVVSETGNREIRLSEFYTGVRSTTINRNEIIKEIIIDAKSEQVSIFRKHGLRKAQAISLVNTAICAELNLTTIKNIRIAAGAVAPKIIRLVSLENELIGKSINELSNYQILERSVPEISPISDIRSSAGYRTDMVRNAIQQCLNGLSHAGGASLTDRKKLVLLDKLEESREMYSIKNTVLISKSDEITLEINGRTVVTSNVLGKTLLELIRENLKLTGTKEGCGEGECGACTVFLDGKAVMACLVPAARAHLAKVTTIEGIGTEEHLHPVQKTFIEEGAVQCGYCTPGFIMSSVMLLEETEKPEREQIVQAISGNLCRCTGYYKIIQAIEKASLNQPRK